MSICETILQFFDVVLYTTENETHKFPVHKAILHARCAYLSRYISEALSYEDIRDESGIQMVEIHDIDHELLKAVLIYLYTDQVEISPHKIDELSIIGLQYGLVRLHNCNIVSIVSSYLTSISVRIIFMEYVSFATLKHIIPYMILLFLVRHLIW